ncbi:Flp family type IVb pilin [Nocardioides sp. CBS4Y-1]|uniref:Flp family type IVb pilin n=1 Tax=Nocardioides acrostichi TaxID=2784339 RepID=A0A930UTI1_9ACTN|nr:Flp family type IVb pilin [Nocardioides acrostichi]
MTTHSRVRAEHSPERGASAAEYALLIAGIAAVLVLVIVALGGDVRGLFDLTDACQSAGSSSTC